MIQSKRRSGSASKRTTISRTKVVGSARPVSRRAKLLSPSRRKKAAVTTRVTRVSRGGVKAKASPASSRTKSSARKSTAAPRARRAVSRVKRSVSNLFASR